MDQIEKGFSKFQKPEIDGFYNLNKLSGTRFETNQQFTMIAERLSAETSLTGANELILEEAYDYFSQDSFNYLFPQILNAYLGKVFSFGGNFASKFWDTIPPEEGGDYLTKKFGRASRITNFTNFSKSLSKEQLALLKVVLAELEIMADQEN